MEDKTAISDGLIPCVVDHGLFLPLAHRLAETYGNVFYHTPCEEAFPHFAKRAAGDGFKHVIRCNDIWKVKDRVGLWVFPDIGYSGTQIELESQGGLVWGSRNADTIEIHRNKFLRVLSEIGLDVPKHTFIDGLTALRKYLKKESDCWVKMSVFRGDFETHHHQVYEQSLPWLDQLAVKFGPFQDEIPFVVCENIETDIEVGYDGFCIDGSFPSTGVQGYEAKNRAYIAAVRDYDDLPEQVREVNDAFGPELAKYRYRNFLSTEIRIKGDKCYFIDPCLRQASPAGESLQRMMSNLPQVIAAGAAGELIEPEWSAQFTAECALTVDTPRHLWTTVDVPDDARQWVMLPYSCEQKDMLCIPPDESDDREVGWVVGIGDSIEDAVREMKEHAGMIGRGVKAHTEAIAELLLEIQKAEDRGVDFTDQPIPGPEIAVEET